MVPETKPSAHVEGAGSDLLLVYRENRISNEMG